MFALVKSIFFATIKFLSRITGCNALKCISMNNQKCRVRSEILNINSNEPILYPYSIKVNKCRGSCNNITDPYAKLCVSDVVKSI